MKVNLTIGIPVWLDRICAWPVLFYRQWKYGYSFRRLCLGVGDWTMVDQKDYYRFGKFHWCLGGYGKKVYVVRSYKIGPERVKTVRLHREIMQPPKGLLVDHRNGNTLDNRRDNLRLATHTQNMQNCRKRKNTASKYIGMWRDKLRNQWAVRITHNKKKIWIGRFDSEIDAARAYDRAAIKYHGDFARLNFPQNVGQEPVLRSLPVLHSLGEGGSEGGTATVLRGL
jgi:hypothetical protein